MDKLSETDSLLFLSVFILLLEVICERALIISDSWSPSAKHLPTDAVENRAENRGIRKASHFHSVYPRHSSFVMDQFLDEAVPVNECI